MLLGDTSAWISRRRDSEADDWFRGRLRRGEIATCPMVQFELLHEVRNGQEFDERRAQLGALVDCPIGPVQWRRALDVWRELAHQGGSHHRSVGHQDLLIAAAAESAGAELLHYDEDFDRIAAITGQPVRWLAERGSL